MVTYKTAFWILFGFSMIMMFLGFITQLSLVNQNDYHKEYSMLLCEGFNIELEFIKVIYPDFAENKCEDIRILVNETAKADILCDQIKGIKWPDKLDCDFGI